MSEYIGNTQFTTFPGVNYSLGCNHSLFDCSELDEQKSFSDDIAIDMNYDSSSLNSNNNISPNLQPEQNKEEKSSINEPVINKEACANSLTRPSQWPNNKFLIINKEDKIQGTIHKKRKRRIGVPEEKRRKYCPDDLLLKIEVNYINFIVVFLNFLLAKFRKNKGEKFIKISPEFKKNVAEENFAKNIDKTLAEVISQDASKKYKKYKANHNKILCDEIQKDEKMKKILNQSYLKLFQEVYYPSNRKINLKSLFGIDEVIYLPEDIEMFKDKFRPKPNFTDSYIRHIHNIANEIYFKRKLIFFS